VVGLSPRPLYPCEQSPPYQLDQRLSGPLIRSGCRGEKKTLAPARNRTLAYHSRSVTIPTELFILQVRRVFFLRNFNIVGFFFYLLNCYMFRSYDHLQTDILSRTYPTYNGSVVCRMLVIIMNDYSDRFIVIIK
jgi:hypothetical protein